LPETIEEAADEHTCSQNRPGALVSPLLLTGCATPQDKQAQAERDAFCAVLDTNKDGKITKGEFMAQATDKAKALEVFEKCDTGKKGYLTYDEVWSRRTMLPPEFIVTTPPLVQPVRPAR
jgi:hypothetical protein